MNDAKLDAYFAKLIALGYMREEPLPDGRIDHVLTPEGEKGVQELIYNEMFCIQSFLREANEMGG